MVNPEQKADPAALAGPEAVVAWRVEVLEKVFTYMFGLMTAILLVESALSFQSRQWHALPALSLAVVLQGVAASARGLRVRVRAAVFAAAALVGLAMSLPVLGFGFPIPFIVAGLTLTLLALCVSQRFALLALLGLVLVILGSALVVCFLRTTPLAAPLAASQPILDPNRFGNWIRITVIFAAVGAAMIGAVGFLVRRLTEAVSHNAGLFSSLQEASRDRIRALEDREVMSDKIRRADELHVLGLLSATVAHDFNNLLMVIMGNAAVLKPVLDDRAREDLVEIERAGERAAELCRSLLTLAGERISPDEIAQLNGLIEEELPLLRRLVTSRVTVEWSPGPSVWIKCARKEMRQALMNLCANARDAMPRGGTLRIATARVGGLRPGMTSGGLARLTISDDGVGMDAATRDRIFEPFFTTKGKAKGTGLGMTVVSAAVERLGGYLELESEPGRGTTFTLLFPLAREPAREIDPPAAPAARPQGAAARTVLVVDDDEGARKVLARYLKRHEYAVVTASDGQEALELLKGGQSVDLVISDAEMPRMGGRALLAEVSKDRPDLPFLFCSGYSGDTAAGQGLDGPHRALLVKPFSEDALLREVRRLLGGSTTGPA